MEQFGHAIPIQSQSTSEHTIRPQASSSLPQTSTIGLTPESPVGEQSSHLVSAQSGSQPTEPLCANLRPQPQALSKQLAERLALEKAMPARIIAMKNEDFAAFREVLEEYKFRNLLAIAESKLTSRVDVLRNFS
jgi:hypothetical protein